MVGDVVASVLPRVTECVVVDDGSGDGTGAAARAAGALVVTHAVNRGQGAALMTGIRCALRRGADIVVTLDADGQHDPADIRALVAPILADRADVVLGSRFLGHAHLIPPMRRRLLRAAVVFTRWSTGLDLTDTHNGFRALSRRAASAIELSQDRMAHASEILERIAALDLRHVEVPVAIRYTDYSTGKGQSAWGAFRILVDLWVSKVMS